MKRTITLQLQFAAGSMFVKKQFKLIKKDGAQKNEPSSIDKPVQTEPQLEHKISSYTDLLRESETISPYWFPHADGKTLELGNTGFYIKLQDAVMYMPIYIGYSPEHKTIGGANTLQSVKITLQALARERAEFAPPKKSGAIELKK